MALAPVNYNRNCQSASISTEIKVIDESFWSPDFQMSLCTLQRSRCKHPIKKFPHGTYLTTQLMFTGCYWCTCIQITECTKFWRCILEFGVGLVKFSGFGSGMLGAISIAGV